MHLVADDGGALLRDLAGALREASEQVRLCVRCGGITTATEPVCRLCTSGQRDGHVICVVEEPGAIGAIEASGAFRGRYHALFGRLSPMHGEGPKDLRLDALVARIADEGIQEVVLALGTDVESEATSAYIRERLRTLPVRVTRLASGLPAGSGPMYADVVTLARAVQGRREM